MNYKKFLGAASAALMIVIVILMLAPGALARKASTKRCTPFSIVARTDPIFPYAGLIFDPAGNLYGTTVYDTSGRGRWGCYASCGIVYKLTPKPDGSWTEETLHLFGSDWLDGYQPHAALVSDTAGNLYGTTRYGGGGWDRCADTFTDGCGVVFKLAPHSDGTWTESVLYAFCPDMYCLDGQDPAGLIFDHDGNLYGTTTHGGAYWWGAVFKLTPQANGSWTESLLHSFTSGEDGGIPDAGLILDQAGNLYGTTTGGGTYGYGTVFRLTPSQDGSWTESVLHSFTGGEDGGIPYAGLILDQAGNLYGTTGQGGNLKHCNGIGCGVVFTLTPNANGSWTENVLHRFCAITNCRDGTGPQGTLTLDAAGNLYGTTVSGGLSGYGVVFKLARNTNGVWRETVLKHFPGGNPGMFPYAGLIFDGAGNLYGTTAGEWRNGVGWVGGTVFEITP